MDWATFWAILSQAHLVTLLEKTSLCVLQKYEYAVGSSLAG
jgi:hypothetical protein